MDNKFLDITIDADRIKDLPIISIICQDCNDKDNYFEESTGKLSRRVLGYGMNVHLIYMKCNQCENKAKIAYHPVPEQKGKYKFSKIIFYK